MTPNTNTLHLVFVSIFIIVPIIYLTLWSSQAAKIYQWFVGWMGKQRNSKQEDQETDAALPSPQKASRGKSTSDVDARYKLIKTLAGRHGRSQRNRENDLEIGANQPIVK